MTSNTHNRAAILASIAMLLPTGSAFAISNITIQDNAPDLNWFSGNGSATAGGNTTNGPLRPLSVGNEDNETERVGTSKAIAGQAWDMEGMFLSANGTKLYIVSGYDMLNGIPEGRPGDLFIKIGGTQPAYNPVTSMPAIVKNGVASGSNYTAPYNYSFALDLSLASYAGGTSDAGYSPVATGAQGTFGAGNNSVNVYDLNNNSQLYTVQNDVLHSNPWKFANGVDGQSVDATFSTGVKYYTGIANTNSNPYVNVGTTFAGSLHNILEIDVSWLLGLGNPGDPVWFSYTMQCGNDSVKGFDHVPDSTSSSLLIGIGFAAMAAIGLKRRRLL